jgi:hypothetical protein
MTTTYKLRSQGVFISDYRSEKAAVKAAGEGDEVYMVVKSGTHESKTRVWPTQGETRTN